MQAEAKTAKAGDLLQRSLDASDRRWIRHLAIALVSLVVLAGVAVMASTYFIRSRQVELERNIQQRLEILAGSRGEVVKAWLAGIGQFTNQITQAELMQLFMTELDMSGSADPAASPVADQVPYMEQWLSEFRDANKLLSVALVGKLLVPSLKLPEDFALTPDQRRAVEDAYGNARPVIAPLRPLDGHLALDVLSPVLPPQASAAKGGSASGVLLATLSVAERFQDLLKPGPLAQPGEQVLLVQRSEAGLARIDPATAPFLQPLGQDLASQMRDTMLPFGLRNSVAGSGRVFSVGAPVAGTQWLVVLEFGVDAALAPVEDYRRTVIGIAVLVSLVIVIGSVAVWWQQMGARSKALANQFQRLARHIEGQRRLLDNINAAISDHIGLKGPAGHYVYVNPSFAKARNADPEEIVGKDDRDLFGPEVAQRLFKIDQQAMSTGEIITFSQTLRLGERIRHLEISRSPLLDDEGEITGIVSVSRDVTELVEQRLRREAAMNQTMEALVQTIELRDPYLAGHSRHLRAFARMMGKECKLSEDDVAAVEFAANLSQIGKIFVPNEILNKPGRLTPEENLIMQGHIRHAMRILEPIDFELPVARIIGQMYERLDGSGYPGGLKGDEIDPLAMILGSLDVFCARIEPRSYRPPISAEEALDVLAKYGTSKYDQKIVGALARIIASPEGKTLCEEISSREVKGVGGI